MLKRPALRGVFHLGEIKLQKIYFLLFFMKDDTYPRLTIVRYG